MSKNLNYSKENFPEEPGQAKRIFHKLKEEISESQRIE